MILKIHKAFSFLLIAIMFLFLSSAPSAASIVKIPFGNSQFSNNCFGQNPMEGPEDSSLQTSFFEIHDGDCSFRHSFSNRLSKKEINCIIFDYKEWLPKFSIVSYNPLLRPAYYHLLFRHKLF